ncbi:MAG: SAM-dependent methyltransferase [Ruminococcaceae bacterium]|nr:SAM-dependent methyltransferase [Oscillospiraceae bacterium]
MTDFIEIVTLAYKTETLKKIIFSRPMGDFPEKISARLCAHRGQKLLAAELSLSGNTVSQKNLREGEIEEFLRENIKKYNQVNLITSLGEAEYKRGKKGDVVLGGDKLKRKLSNDGSSKKFEIAIESLEREKNRILKGDEPFLISLGISDKSGRVHDKRQAKFRQINKFLEYFDEVYPELDSEKELIIYDLCCGKSYLSFAVYHFLTVIKQRKVYILGIDLKKDVMEFCNSKARELGFDGMRFITDDITNTPNDTAPDMVISLHACDVATDIVLDTAARLGARVILSTPCCHRELSTKINSPELSFVTRYPKLKRSLCDSLTDALRLARLEVFGYEVNATELVDPDDTPKNTLIRAIKREGRKGSAEEYNRLLEFLLGDAADDYIGKI